LLPICVYGWYIFPITFLKSLFSKALAAGMEEKTLKTRSRHALITLLRTVRVVSRQN
jgi:hypothetical protein